MNGFSKDTFKRMSKDAQMLVLFDLQLASHEFLKEAMNCHDKKIEKLSDEVQNVKSWHSVRWPAMFGIVGGAVAMAGKWVVNLF